jgi:hypothetical protein
VPELIAFGAPGIDQAIGPRNARTARYAQYDQNRH